MFPADETLSIDTPSRKTFVYCKFQKPCWKTIRAPKARKFKIHLPYTCSYQVEGDVHKCSHRDTFIREENYDVVRGNASNDLSATGVSGNNL